jgi:DNA-binding beta-propeller fold protein YncE
MKRRLVIVAAFLAAPGCSTVTGPHAGPGHPEGVLVASPGVASRPFAVAVSAKGTVYVGRQDVPYVQATVLPGLTFGDSVRVGLVPTDIAFNSAGTLAYVTNQFSSNLEIINVAAGTATDSVAFPDHADRVLVAPGDALVYVSVTNDSLYAVSTSTRTIVARWGFSGLVNGLAFSPGGASLYVTTTNGQIGRISTINGARDTVTVGGMLQDVAVLGDELFVANESGKLQVRSATSFGLIDSIPVSGVFGLKASLDGQRLFATASGAGLIFIANPASRAVLDTLNVGGMPRRIAFTADGLTALVGNEANVVNVIK